MARNSLLCADVPLRNYSLTHISNYLGSHQMQHDIVTKGITATNKQLYQHNNNTHHEHYNKTDAILTTVV